MSTADRSTVVDQPNGLALDQMNGIAREQGSAHPPCAAPSTKGIEVAANRRYALHHFRRTHQPFASARTCRVRSCPPAQPAPNGTAMPACSTVHPVVQPHGHASSAINTKSRTLGQSPCRRSGSARAGETGAAPAPLISAANATRSRLQCAFFARRERQLGGRASVGLCRSIRRPRPPSSVAPG